MPENETSICNQCLCNKPYPQRSFSEPESDILEALRSNKVLESAEASEISEYIDNAEFDLAVYEAEIERLLPFIDRLRGQTEQLKKRIAWKRALISPVRKLPNEILASIFTYCLGNGYFSNSQYYQDPNFVTVCSLWRSVALNSPEIWSNVSLTLEDSYVPSRTIRAVTRYLAQSQMRPLVATLRIKFGPYPYHHTAADCLTAFLSQAHRWRNLSIYLQDNAARSSDDIWGLLTKIEHLPLLQTLEFASNFSDTNQTECVASQILVASPNLRHLRVQGTGNTIPLSFPTQNQVTRLELGPSVDPSVFGLVERCPGIHVLVYHLNPTKNGSSGFVPQRSNVRELNIILKDSKLGGSRRSTNRLPQLIGSLTFPFLQSLGISSNAKASNFTPNWSRDSFDIFFLQSKCQLTSLSLGPMKGGVLLSDLDVIHLLALVPTLRSLAIHESRRLYTEQRIITTSLCQSLHAADNHHSASVGSEVPSKPLVPKLQDLRFTSRGPFDVDAFVRMVLSRCQSASSTTEHAVLDVSELLFLRLHLRSDTNSEETIHSIKSGLGCTADWDGRVKIGNLVFVIES